MPPREEEMRKEIFGKSFFKYTRSQALSDGVLFDLSSIALEAGVKSSVACTPGVKALLEVPAGLENCQDEKDRTWDVLITLYFAIKLFPARVDRLPFHTLFQKKPNEKPELVDLRAYFHPGDDGEPVITITLPHDD